MDFDLDLTDVEPERIGGGSNKFPIGQFHVQINSFTPWGGKNHDQIVVQMQALAGSVENCNGTLHDEYFDPGHPVAKSILLGLAIACRLTTREALKEMKEKTGRTTIKWEDIEGRQCVVTTAMDKKENKYLNIATIHDVDDEKIKNVPRNEPYLERFRKFHPLEGQSQAPTEPAPQQQEQPATEEGSFDDMF